MGIEYPNESLFCFPFVFQFQVIQTIDWYEAAMLQASQDDIGRDSNTLSETDDGLFFKMLFGNKRFIIVRLPRVSELPALRGKSEVLLIMISEVDCGLWKDGEMGGVALGVDGLQGVVNLKKLRMVLDLLVLVSLCFVLLKLNAREPEYRLMNPIYWWQRVQGKDLYDPRGILWHGNRTRREIALTFDDGPHPDTTPQVLDALKAEGVQATFFLLGKRIRENPDIVKRMLEEGHEAGCHSYDHQNQTTLTQQQVWQQIWDSRVLIGRVNGHFTAYRSPWLEWNENVLNAAREHKLPMVMCSYASDPQASRSGEKWARIVAHHTHNGSILLLHDTYPATARDLPYLLRELKQRGYHFVTITQMMKNLP